MVQQWAGAEDCFPCCSQQVSSCCLLLGANGSLGKAGSLVISTTTQVETPPAPLQLIAASHAVKSAGPWKSSRASARASSCSSGSAWICAVVASLRGPQRRFSWRPSASQSCTARVWRISSRGCRQGEQVQQGVEVGLLAQFLKAEPHHLLIQKHLQRLGGGSEHQVRLSP